MSKDQIAKEIRNMLHQTYGARFRKVILYESEARGEASLESDIDILVLLEGPVDYGTDLERNIDALYPLSRRLGRRISAKPVDINIFETVDCPLFRNAQRDGIVG